MTPKFKVGDIVKNIVDDNILKIEIVNHDVFMNSNRSGREYEFKGTYHCSWTDSKGESQEGDFSEAVLSLFDKTAL